MCSHFLIPKQEKKDNMAIYASFLHSFWACPLQNGQLVNNIFEKNSLQADYSKGYDGDKDMKKSAWIFQTVQFNLTRKYGVATRCQAILEIEIQRWTRHESVLSRNLHSPLSFWNY